MYDCTACYAPPSTTTDHHQRLHLGRRRSRFKLLRQKSNPGVDAENARHENTGQKNTAQNCKGWKMQEWEKTGNEQHGTTYFK